MCHFAADTYSMYQVVPAQINNTLHLSYYIKSLSESHSFFSNVSLHHCFLDASYGQFDDSDDILIRLNLLFKVTQKRLHSMTTLLQHPNNTE